MDKDKFSMFLQELRELEEKYGYCVSADYEEEIHYDWDEEPYVASVEAYLLITDSNGDQIKIYERNDVGESI